MLDDINVLREKLEQQVLDNEPYSEILATSKQIDELLVKYYASISNYTLLV